MKRMLIALALTLAALCATPARAQTVNDGTIHLCVDKQNLKLRLASGPGQCRQHEVSLTLPLRGAQGPAGPQGPRGPQGAKGDTGAQGPQGIQGVQGIKGDTGDRGPQGYSIKTYADDGSNFPRGCGPQGGLVLISVDVHGAPAPGSLPQYLCNGAEGPQGLPGAGGGSTELYYTNTNRDFDVDEPEPLAKLTLPEGTFFVSAKVRLSAGLPTDATETPAIFCHLSDGTTVQQTTTRARYVFGRPSEPNEFDMILNLPMTFGTGGGNAFLSCNQTSPRKSFSIVVQTQLWALKLDALHIQQQPEP
jgi:hypothetical protein